MKIKTIMPQNHKTKKTVFEGSLARRAFLICFALLILPLFVHTFLLYRKELQDEEKIIRTDLRAIGAQKAQHLSEQIHADWQLLENRANWLDIQAISLPAGASSRFAVLDEEKQSLITGIAISETHAIAIERPLKTLLAMPEPPSFPIDITLTPNALTNDQWQEPFPIPDTNLTLTVGTSSQRIYDLQISHLILRVASFLFFVAVIGGGAVYFLLRKAYRPLNALRLTMERVADGAIHSRYTPHKWGFELNDIGRCFNDTLNSVLLHQEEAEAERLAREKLAQELKLGHEIQESLLPKTFPSMPNLDIGAGCLPAQEVGGDFYDVFRLPSGKCLIAVADLAGKGISACLFSLGLRSSLRALASTTDNLSEIVTKANDLFLLDAKDNGDFATLWIGILESKTLHYISLGHPPVLLKRQGQFHELSTHHPALGLMPFSGLKIATQFLEPGDELLLYSDGATEAHNTSQELYGRQRLKESFLRCQSINAQSDADLILQDIQRFSQGTFQHDDLTLLLIRLV
ncbi:MAG TPA: PP2C family protein-serine/threonine phosphatase [Chlamydiales bacterium]|jgi:serine phosphatase RsbU (regulator of sigma subunit)|nr:PP2C family protein-serine/threonine phosphatase [Chlamydiales bacterium]